MDMATFAFQQVHLHCDGGGGGSTDAGNTGAEVAIVSEGPGGNDEVPADQQPGHHVHQELRKT